MGFCLFKEAGPGGVYFAVNVAHVEECRKIDQKGVRACLLQLPFRPDGFMPLAVGVPEEVQSVLAEGARIGLNKVETGILAGQIMALKATPLLLNNPDRVALVREMKPEEFKSAHSDFSTASQMFYLDGTMRMIAGRAGTFAMKANAGGNVPVLDD